MRISGRRCDNLGPLCSRIVTGWGGRSSRHALANNISVRAEWLCPGGPAHPYPSKILRWQKTLGSAPIQRVAVDSALPWLFRCLFSLCQYLIVIEQCRVVANCDHTSEWVHSFHQENLNRSRSHTEGSISTMHFVFHTRLCYSHKIRYIIVWHT